MPQKEKQRRAPAGMCTPHKKTKTVKGRTYIYWEAKVTVGYDLNGRQLQKTLAGKTQREVVEKAKAVQADVDRGTFSNPPKMTLSEFLDIWITDYCKNIKPRTLDSYISNCNTHIKPALGSVELSKLTSIQIQRFYNGLKNATTGKPLSPKTVSNIHGTLHRALERARLNKFIPFNPADSDFVELPIAEKREISPFEDAEAARLISELEGNRYRNVILFMLFSGLREGEALGITDDEIDWGNRTIRVKHQLQKNRQTKEYELISPKNKKPRTILLSEAAISLLKDQIRQRALMQEISGKAWSNPDNLVFTMDDGRRMCAQTVYCNFKRRVKAIGCDDKRVHDLRHSFATASLLAGDDIKTVQHNLGHHTAAFTLSTYGHITQASQKESAARMDAYADKLMQNAKGETKGETV